jgi:methionyl-tRNA synthetase
MQKILGMTHPHGREYPTMDEIVPWNQIAVGTKMEKPQSLFPRVDYKATPPSSSAEKKGTAKATSASKAQHPAPSAMPSTGEKKPANKEPLKPEIAFDDFTKIDLRVGTILAAEKIKKSNKLLKLSVDLGEESHRQIVAGIAKSYDPDQLIGKQVVVVANLKPAKLMGETSQGMVLAANDGKELFLSGFTAPLPAGSPVK